jgi:hypothetical protein
MAYGKKEKTLLQKHSKHHTKKHMSLMVSEMSKNNKTFKQAHTMAMRKVGK